MARKYSQHFSTRQAVTPQSQPLPDAAQVKNSAGGYAWAVDDWVRLDRFLVLGCEGPTYYASEKALTVENALAVRRCLRADGARAVGRVVEISEAGRAPKNDPAVFALALAASHGDTPTRELALAALPRVCRTGTHLFQFAEAVQGFRGWGRALRRAVGRWYTGRDARDLAYQCVKYQQREGWAHRDLLRLAHPKAEGDTQDVLRWAVKGWDGAAVEVSDRPALLPIWATERARRATTVEEVVALVREHGLVRECVPTEWLTHAAVWEALLEQMPLTALVRNLATMTRVGLLAPNSAAARRVAEVLSDGERLRRARVHPIALLAALKTYAAGRGARGRHEWVPVPEVIDALDGAFYASFGNVEPTGQRWMLALDVSGSMDGGTVAGVPGLTPRVASAALALVTAAVEPLHYIVAFSTHIRPVDISPRMGLDTVVQTISDIPMGGTDCAQPMLHALETGLAIDTFVVLTDSETWAGGVHPAVALRRYRERTGIPAKLIVVGMVSNGFTIADPADAGMLDVVGMDIATPQLMSDFAAR
jgi:60 kDa SS-A/Ro ribonucleoprotein